MNEITTTAAADLGRVRLVMCGLTDATTDAYDAAEAGDLGRLALELARVADELADVMRAVEAARR